MNLFKQVEDTIVGEWGWDRDTAKHLAVGASLAFAHPEWAAAFVHAARQDGASKLHEIADIIVERFPAEITQ